MHKNFVHKWIFGETLKHICVTFSKNPKKLHDETFRLSIIENRWIVWGIKDELKVDIVDDFFNFANVHVVVDVLQLEAQLEILIVEDPYFSLRVIFENLDHSCRVNKVGLEEWRKNLGISKYLLVALELIQRFHVPIIYSTQYISMIISYYYYHQ